LGLFSGRITFPPDAGHSDPPLKRRLFSGTVRRISAERMTLLYFPGGSGMPVTRGKKPARLTQST